MAGAKLEWSISSNKCTLDDSSLHLSTYIAATKRHKKSNSYCGASSVAVKPLVCVQKSLSGDDNNCSIPGAVQCNHTLLIPEIDADIMSREPTEYDTFLSISSSSKSNSDRRRAAQVGAHGLLIWLLNTNWFLPIAIVSIFIVIAFTARHKAEHLFIWIEQQNGWIIFAIFIMLFILVSFPIMVGYFVLMLSAGYIFGWFKGCLTVVIGANLGMAIAHRVMHKFRHRMPVQRLTRHEMGRAILRVISGPKAFKVVLFTRLTPIPFGIQNAIFGISSISATEYHLASFIGLLPAQLINVYLGSTLHSIQQVLKNGNSKWTGFIGFALEVICGIGLMIWVVKKARSELSEALQTNTNNEERQPLSLEV